MFTFHRYWSTKSLYNGLWAREFMGRDRFKALMAMLHIVDPLAENEKEKLSKISTFADSFKEQCKSIYQPTQHVAVDERLVKSKHRSGIRQFIANKPAKFGLKLSVLADSSNGYTYDFDVYTGKHSAPPTHKNGLGYSVVMRLCEPLLNQGYHVFFDNFYTSVALVKDLWALETPSCGTVNRNRKGFPESLKNGKAWARKKKRGDMRWHCDGNCLALQWKNNKVVTMLSTTDSASDFAVVNRKEKNENKWKQVSVKQHGVIQKYNSFMNGVDKSDQILSENNLLRKCLRWWKTLFFHMIDIATVNGFIVFQIHRANHPELESLQRPAGYS